MKSIEQIAFLRHVACWQIVQGALGRWYRIEKHPEGHWLQRTGPYRNRQGARDWFQSDPIDEPSKWPTLMAKDVAHGHNHWYVVVHVGEIRWAQLAGPFKTRTEARKWVFGYEL
jgi:hypothetical protein